MIYADHAATTRLLPVALEAMLPYLTEQYGNPSSLYSFGQKSREAVDVARATIARLLGGADGRLYFTSGGTESDNWALRGLAALRREKGGHIITSAIEHPALLQTAKALAGEGFTVTYLPVDKFGLVSPQDLARAITPNTFLVSVMLANNEMGAIEPIAQLSKIAHEHGALFHSDGVQAVGHIPVDVAALGIDLLTLSGHKFGAPRGIGALWVAKGIPLAPLMAGGGQELGKRSGTENTPAIIAMAAALSQAVSDLDQESARLEALGEQLAHGLLAIDQAQLTGPQQGRLPGHVSMIFPAIEGESLVLLLDGMGVCSSSGSACSSVSLEPSHVLLALGLPHELAHGSLRLTLGRETTKEQVDTLVTIIPQAVARLRAMSPLWPN